MRIVLKILKWFGIGLGTLLIAGIVYQFMGSRLDQKYAPPPSARITMGGRTVHFACRDEGLTCLTQVPVSAASSGIILSSCSRNPLVSARSTGRASVGAK
jgi:hypothetical protein